MIQRIAAAGTLAVAAGAGAQVWGTFEDFSVASNPGGPWSYGWRTGAAFTLFDHAAMLTPDLAVWTGAQFPDSAPCVGINPSFSAHMVPGTTIQVPARSAWCRPGPAGESAVFVFTAPATGNYTINGVFRQIDAASAGATNLTIRIGSDTLVNMDIAAGGGVVLDPSPARRLSLGQTIEFVLGPTTTAGGAAMEVQGHISRTFACYANCDASTTEPVLNVQDFTCFLNTFAAGDAAANCDGSTTPPVLNVQDFACFLNAFAAGCTAP